MDNVRDYLVTLTGDELIQVFNAQGPENPLTGPWKAGKGKLADKLLALSPGLTRQEVDEALDTSDVETAKAPEPAAEVVEEPAAIEETQVQVVPEPEPEPQPEIDPVKPLGETVEMTAEDRARLPQPGKTIRETALRLLTFVHYHEDSSKASGESNRVEEKHPKAGSVGLTYLNIISLIKEAFPDANTSVACLRWYAVKVRAEEKGYEGWRLTRRRPRLIPPRPVKEAA